MKVYQLYINIYNSHKYTMILYHSRLNSNQSKEVRLSHAYNHHNVKRPEIQFSY